MTVSVQGEGRPDPNVPSAVRSWCVQSLDDTQRLAVELASLLHVGAVLLLDGPLGAGKTTLVRALVAALGGDGDDVASPTFSLMHHYQADVPIVHLDAYRLTGPGDLAGLGFHELADHAISCIEWGDRVASAVDPACTWRLRIELAGSSPHVRDCTLTPPPPRSP